MYYLSLYIYDTSKWKIYIYINICICYCNIYLYFCAICNHFICVLYFQKIYIEIFMPKNICNLKCEM